MSVVAYRHAAYDTPLWVNPSSRAGRFHRALEEPTQYLALHPLGPAAEMVRHQLGSGGADDLDMVRLNLWAVKVDDSEFVRIDFDDCAAWGIAPEDLVGDDYTATQALADELRRRRVPGVVVPSAALPGTFNVVAFTPRVADPYNETGTVASWPVGHLTDGGRPPREVVHVVRWLGTPHPSLEQWRSEGAYPVFADPAASRW